MEDPQLPILCFVLFFSLPPKMWGLESSNYITLPLLLWSPHRLHFLSKKMEDYNQSIRA